MYSNIPAIGCLVALVSRDHLDLKMGIPPMYVSAVMLMMMAVVMVSIIILSGF